MHKLNIILFISAFVLSSCEEEIAFKGSDMAQKLVVNCLIAADSTVIAHVKHSNSIQNPGNGDNVVSNALVKLYENSQFVGFLTFNADGGGSNDPYESNNAYTLNDFKTTGGNSYKLEVEASNYEPVTAQISIPQPVPIVSVDTSYITIRESWGDDRSAINFAITFNDPTSEKNFYRIVLRQKSGMYGGGGYNSDTGWYYYIKVSQRISPLQSKDLSINPTGSSNEELFEVTPNSAMVFSNDLFDGKKYAISVFTKDYTRPYYAKKEFREYTIELHSLPF